MFDPFQKSPENSPELQVERFLERYPEQKRQAEANIANYPFFVRPFLYVQLKMRTWRLDRLYEKLRKERNLPPGSL